MAGHAHLAARPLRIAVALVAALALLLPLPARCAACTLQTDHCARCAAGDSLRPAEPAAPIRSCCQQQHDHGLATTTVDDANFHDHHACGCAYHHVPRNTPASALTISISPELIACVLLSDTLPLQLSANNQSAYLFATAALPPPVPHRILHCSWII